MKDMKIVNMDEFKEILDKIKSTPGCEVLHLLMKQIYVMLFFTRAELKEFLNNGSIVLICSPSTNSIRISIFSIEKIAVIHVTPCDGTQIDIKGPIDLNYWGIYFPFDKFPDDLQQKYSNEGPLYELGDKIRMIHSIVYPPPMESSTIN